MGLSVLAAADGAVTAVGDGPALLSICGSPP